MRAVRMLSQLESVRITGKLFWLRVWPMARATGLAPMIRKPLGPGSATLSSRASGRAVWIATNAHPQAWQLKLEHTGLFGHFDRVISPHDFGAPKESPDFWTRMQARHPYAPATALFVDDSHAVLDAARAYGIGQVVGIRHPDRSRPPRPLARLFRPSTPRSKRPG